MGLEVDINFEDKLHLIITAAEDKKAENVVVLDFSNIEGSITDAFVICSGASERQVEAISDHIVARLAEHKVRPGHWEGRALNQWVLLDYGDIVVHVFLDHIRDFYRLENLWNHAPRLRPKPGSPSPADA